MANGLSRVERESQIIQEIWENPGISTRAIAKAIGMSNSKHFRQLVQGLYERGVIWHCPGAVIAGRETNNWYPPLWDK